jgi:hypothetical protein
LTIMKKDFSRREWIVGAGAAAGYLLARPSLGFAAASLANAAPRPIANAPVRRVTVGKCRD